MRPPKVQHAQRAKAKLRGALGALGWLLAAGCCCTPRPPPPSQPFLPPVRGVNAPPPAVANALVAALR